MKTRKTWEKLLGIFLAVVLILGMIPVAQLLLRDKDSHAGLSKGDKIYFKPAHWKTDDNPRFEAYFFGSDTVWVALTDDDGDGTYEGVCPGEYSDVIFVRKDPTSTPLDGWNGKWNQTADLTIPDGKNCFEPSSNGWEGTDGTWSTYTPPVTKEFYVTGDAGLTGEDWKTDTDKMTVNSSGLYEYVYSGVAAGSYKFKITDGTDSWGDSNATDGKYTVTLEERSNVTITFDSSTNKITTKVVPSESVTGDCYVMGDSGLTGDDWEPKADKMALNNGVYTLTYANVPVGTYSFRITDGTLDNTWPADADKTFKVRTAGKVTITFNATTREITVTTPDPASSLSDYYFTGNFNDWNPADFFYNMYWNKTTERYEYVGIMNAGSYEYKVAKGSLDSGKCWPDYGKPGQTASLSNRSKVKISFNPSDGSVTWTDLGVIKSGEHDVDTDIVDYLNNMIVDGRSENNYQTNYEDSYSQFGYINQMISNKDYSIPLYFGNLLHINNRYGGEWAELDDRDWNVKDNGKWYTAANVAPNNANGGTNYEAVVQGLVGSELKNGNLIDPYTGEELFYFSKTIAQNDGMDVMKYYSNLKFPFEKYTDANGVSTYFYDSETSKAVYLVDGKLTNENTTPSDNYTNGSVGFWPLNAQDQAHSGVNCGFGVKFTVEFTVSDEGIMVDGQPVTFDFTGDDDVWVFIDDQLVLDMGGCHTKAKGVINFATLTATVANGFDINDKGLDNFGNISGNDGSSQRANLDTGVITKYFPEKLANAFDEEYRNNKAEVHTLTMFYMERGMFDSNMSISFSITPLPSGLTVSKDIEGVDGEGNVTAINPGLNADIQAKDTFSFVFNVNFFSYALTDLNGVATRYDATNKTITGVRGDIYASTFWANAEGTPAFGAGTSFVITEQIPANTVFEYDTNYTRWNVWDADNGYKQVEGALGKDMSAEFSFPSGDEPSNYALNFVNAIKVGSLTVTKTNTDGQYEGRNFTFQIELDLDGDEDDKTFAPTYYEGLVYKVGNVEYKTKADGKFTLKPGETAIFTGIPVGASYKVTEVYNADVLEPTYTNNTGDIISGTVAVTVDNNQVTNAGPNHVIYVESQDVHTTDKGWQKVPYTIKDTSGNAFEIVSLQSVSGITVELTDAKNGIVTVTAAPTAGKYVLTYIGQHEAGVNAEGVMEYSRYKGTLTIHVVQATEKNYVFDFGLSSNLANVTGTTEKPGSGLFEGGAWGVAGQTTATLKDLVKDDTTNSQTEIIAATGSTINVSTGEYAGGAITFNPLAIMSQAETYTYKVWVGDNDSTNAVPTYGSLSPEDGAWVTGYITVMPANTVYYEDSFALDNSFALPGLTQSNNMDENYGKDDAYKSGLTYSNGDKTPLANNQTATFTFTGTGFDIISMTTVNSGGMRVDVKAENGEIKTYYVDCVYKNGTLYQVPVIAVMDLAYGTYTVTITSLNTYDSTDENGNAVATTGGVYIDGIRIYNPLKDTSGYIPTEQSVYFTELRDMYFSGSTLNGLLTESSFAAGNLSLVRLDGSNSVYVNPAAIVENYTGSAVKPAYTWADVYQSGPNNEMYLPKDHGIQFSFNAITGNGTLQIGAKATGSAGKISVYVNGVLKHDFELNSATDMYYDLTDYLGSNAGTVTIINTSDTDDFVSLTTVKCSYSLS